MKLYFMKQDALDFFKHNMERLYIHYFQDESNGWMEIEYGSNPFSDFIDIPEFELADVDSMSVGEADFENCKILYNNLRMLSESQCSDERLWAGLCNCTFYEYMRKRYQYTTKQLKNKDTDVSAIISRFFFSGGIRAGFFRNGLAKCWWVGHATFEKDNENHFEKLDIIGHNDLASKITDIFYNNTFSSNQVILAGICESLKFFKDNGQILEEKKHIRGAMKYLNAVGGAMLLDVLSQEEIAQIMTSWIIGELKGQTCDISIEEDDEDILEEIDEDDEDEETKSIHNDNKKNNDKSQNLTEIHNNTISADLQKLFDKYEMNRKEITVTEKDFDDGELIDCSSDNKQRYIGKKVMYKFGGIGIIESIDDKYIVVRYQENGKISTYPIGVCNSTNPLLVSI